MEVLNTAARGLAETNAVAAVISAAQGKGPGDGICHCKRGVGPDGVMGKGSFVDWCHVLQVEARADDSTVKRQYRRLVLLLHPDKNPHPKAEEAFKLVSQAYAVLSNSHQRSAHSIRRSSLFPPCQYCNPPQSSHPYPSPRKPTRAPSPSPTFHPRTPSPSPPHRPSTKRAPSPTPTFRTPTSQLPRGGMGQRSASPVPGGSGGGEGEQGPASPAPSRRFASPGWQRDSAANPAPSPPAGAPGVSSLDEEWDLRKARWEADMAQARERAQARKQAVQERTPPPAPPPPPHITPHITPDVTAAVRADVRADVTADDPADVTVNVTADVISDSGSGASAHTTPTRPGLPVHEVHEVLHPLPPPPTNPPLFQMDGRTTPPTPPLPHPSTGTAAARGGGSRDEDVGRVGGGEEELDEEEGFADEETQEAEADVGFNMPPVSPQVAPLQTSSQRGTDSPSSIPPPSSPRSRDQSEAGQGVKVRQMQRQGEGKGEGADVGDNVGGGEEGGGGKGVRDISESGVGREGVEEGGNRAEDGEKGGGISEKELRTSRWQSLKSRISAIGARVGGGGGGGEEVMEAGAGGGCGAREGGGGGGTRESLATIASLIDLKIASVGFGGVLSRRFWNVPLQKPPGEKEVVAVPVSVGEAGAEREEEKGRRASWQGATIEALAASVVAAKSSDCRTDRWRGAGLGAKSIASSPGSPLLAFPDFSDDAEVAGEVGGDVAESDAPLPSNISKAFVTQSEDIKNGAKGAADVTSVNELSAKSAATSTASSGRTTTSAATAIRAAAAAKAAARQVLSGKRGGPTEGVGAVGGGGVAARPPTRGRPGVGNRPLRDTSPGPRIADEVSGRRMRSESGDPTYKTKPVVRIRSIPNRVVGPSLSYIKSTF